MGWTTKQLANAAPCPWDGGVAVRGREIQAFLRTGFDAGTARDAAEMIHGPLFRRPGHEDGFGGTFSCGRRWQ